jgi:PAS domain-containing protein
VGGISVDITDRKLAEKALAAEKEQLAVTLSSIADGVITTDTAGRIVLINRVAQEITGWQLEAARQEPLERVFNVVEAQTDQPGLPPANPARSSSNPPVTAAPAYRLDARDGS